MRVLLMAMPDVAPRLFNRRLKMPNLGLTSLAANAPGHDIRIADLVHVRSRVLATVLELLRSSEPEVVGLSAMSFQYDTALQIAKLAKRICPRAKMVLGGYHATLMWAEITDGEGGRTFDFVVRGEGEKAFAGLLGALEQSDTKKRDASLATVEGLSYKDARDDWHHNPRAAILDLSTLRMPDRGNRVWKRFGFSSYGFEVIETSRGCTMDCNFCSMRHMYGQTFRTYDLDRVIGDLEDVQSRGGGMVLFADDNITLDTLRMEELCNRIIKAKLHKKTRYLVQTSCMGMARAPKLAKYMARAGVDMVFLGIENISKRNLLQMRKGNIVEMTRKAVRFLHDAGIIIAGGMIVGLREDRPRDIAENYEFFNELEIDWPGDQIIQPYPKTKLREELLAEGLVTNPDDFRRYDGYWANVRTLYMTGDEIQFHRWRQKCRYEYVTRPSRRIRRRHPVIGALQDYITYPLLRWKQKVRRLYMSEKRLYELEMKQDSLLNYFPGISRGPVPTSCG